MPTLEPKDWEQEEEWSLRDLVLKSLMLILVALVITTVIIMVVGVR